MRIYSLFLKNVLVYQFIVVDGVFRVKAEERINKVIKDREESDYSDYVLIVEQIPSSGLAMRYNIEPDLRWKYIKAEAY